MRRLPRHCLPRKGLGRDPARPLRRRRQMLVDLMTNAGESSGLQLSPATTSQDQALTWLELVGRGLDGIVAKRLDQAYSPAAAPCRNTSCGRRSTVSSEASTSSPAANRSSRCCWVSMTMTANCTMWVAARPGQCPRNQPEAYALYRRSGLLGTVSRRKEPVERAGTQGRAPAARAGSGSECRSHHRPAFPARRAHPALAHRQGPARLHHGSDRTAACR